jgi:hypothetical protein
MVKIDPWPTELKVDKDRGLLTVAFDDEASFSLSAELLRVMSPSAEVQGHSPEERVTVPGKKAVRIRSVALTVTQNGKRSSLPSSLLGREVAPLQRVAVGEAKTVWPEGVSEWSLDAVVTSDRDETGVARLTWE